MRDIKYYEQRLVDLLGELAKSQAENRAIKRSMLRIIGMCGIPDSKYACLSVIKEIKRVYAEYPESPFNEEGPESNE
jgi:hypothetical protein